MSESTLIVQGKKREEVFDAPSRLRSGRYQTLNIDLSSAGFVKPAHLVSWRCLIDLAMELGISVTGTPPQRTSVFEYCGRMKLFDGTKYKYPYQEHDSPDFFPLHKIQTEGDVSVYDHCQRVFTQSNATPNYVDRLADSISELADNMYWHSGTDLKQGWGYIHAQAYRQRGDIRMSLRDVGIGFYQSYERQSQVRGRTELEIVKDSFNLMESSLNPDPGRGERGIGLNHAWEFIKQFTGFLCVRTGKSMVSVTQRDRVEKELPYQVDGTIIDIRVPIL